MKNILESNELIAKFIGFELLKDLLAGNQGFINIDIDIYEQCKFHSDWNWLMKVVEKIESLGYSLDIKLAWCRIRQIKNINVIVLRWEEDKTKIEAVYNSCIGFIQWYNKQTNK